MQQEKKKKIVASKILSISCRILIFFGECRIRAIRDWIWQPTDILIDSVVIANAAGYRVDIN